MASMVFFPFVIDVLSPLAVDWLLLGLAIASPTVLLRLAFAIPSADNVSSPD